MLNFGNSFPYTDFAICWFPASLAPHPTDFKVKLQGAEDQYIEKFASTIDFTGHEVWTDFRDFLSNFTYFR